MLLPPRTGSEPLTVETEGPLIVIGANGAGKTRFAKHLADSIGDNAYRISALKALYGLDSEDNTPQSLDSMYHAATAKGLIRGDLRGEMDRMVGLMMHQEMLNLLNYKYHHATDDAAAELPSTRLDTMVRLWREVFPHNRVLLETGRMLFAREDTTDQFTQSHLSAGEKAVMYYIGAALLAPKEATIFVDAPEMFLHPSSTRMVWDRVEGARRDCRFVYVTHDLSFPPSRTGGTTVWVKNFDPVKCEWDYDVLPDHDGLSEEMYLAILGARKPVLFIEGDAVHSYDAKLYPLIFPEYTVKSLGGCDRVIEATRSFNGLAAFHNLDAAGIVDRDRRDDHEVEYLRQRKIFVPNVAEVENIFMLEGVIRAVAAANRRDPDQAFSRVRKTMIKLFDTDARRQALEHVRHRVKRSVEHRVDGKFTNINALEQHLHELPGELDVRGQYEALCQRFRSYVARGDYAAILRVYNRKSMLSESHVAECTGVKRGDKTGYIRQVLQILSTDSDAARAIRGAIRRCFGFGS